MFKINDKESKKDLQIPLLMQDQELKNSNSYPKINPEEKFENKRKF